MAAFGAGVLLLVAARAEAAEQPLVPCPARGLRFVEVKIGSPGGRLGSIASTSEFDASGKHGRDIFPLAGSDPLFFVCSYKNGTTLARPLPAAAKECEFDYHYVSDYDTAPDRAFCR